MPSPHHRYTFQEYLEIEEIARIRHEYFAGEIYAMAGGTPEHAAIAAAITSMIATELGGGPCRVYSSDLRVRVLATGLATYPDVTVICGPPSRDPESPTHVTNPKLVVEVLSKATAEYDCGSKLEHYRTIESLEEIVLVDAEAERVEVWTREPGGWTRSAFTAGDDIALASIGCVLSVDAVMAAGRLGI